jgi:periplasmic divalent cation tolerance protein
MKPAHRFALVLVTAPSLKVARQLAQSILQQRQAACVNIIPRLESHYWWQGKLERSTEMLLLIKTSKAKLPALEKWILAEHPYDTPEFIVLPLQSGNQRYLSWISESVKTPLRIPKVGKRKSSAGS